MTYNDALKTYIQTSQLFTESDQFAGVWDPTDYGKSLGLENWYFMPEEQILAGPNETFYEGAEGLRKLIELQSEESKTPKVHEFNLDERCSTRP